MIALKRNDKIIIIVAVAVLVVAAIGVALYSSPEPSVTTVPPSGETQEYAVSWTIASDSLQTLTDFSGKKAAYETMVQIPDGNLKKIMFNLSWVDDRTTILGRFGLDTLTLSVMTPDGEMIEVSNKSAKKTGAGTIFIELDVPNDGMPSTTPIQAPDLQSAQDQLMMSPYYDTQWVNKDFTITVSVKVGEIRPLVRFLDKGNDFELQIMYSYYKSTLTPLPPDEMKNTGSDGTSGDDWSEESGIPPYLSMIINTGCGRFI